MHVCELENGVVEMRTLCVIGVLMVVVVSGAVDAQGQRPLSPAGHSATQIGGDAYDGRQGYVRQLHWEFLDITVTGGRLALLWADRMASIRFTVAE